MTTSPGLQIMGTASGRRSVPASAMSFTISTRPCLWVPGSTQTPLTAVLPCICPMKLKPWISSSKSGLSQWVSPSWCQDTAAPSPASLIKSPSWNGVKSAPLMASATFKSPGWAYVTKQALENCKEPPRYTGVAWGALASGLGSNNFTWWRPLAIVVPPRGSERGFAHCSVKPVVSAPRAGRPLASVAAPISVGKLSRMAARSLSRSFSSSWRSAFSKI